MSVKMIKITYFDHISTSQKLKQTQKLNTNQDQERVFLPLLCLTWAVWGMGRGCVGCCSAGGCWLITRAVATLALGGWRGPEHPLRAAGSNSKQGKSSSGRGSRSRGACWQLWGAAGGCPGGGGWLGGSHGRWQ